MASYSAAHTYYGNYRAASARFHLAVPGPDEGPWRLHALHCPEPGRFRLRAEAFVGSSRPHTFTGTGAARIFALHDGAFEVSGDGTWEMEFAV